MVPWPQVVVQATQMGMAPAAAGCRTPRPQVVAQTLGIPMALMGINMGRSRATDTDIALGSSLGRTPPWPWRREGLSHQLTPH